ncbi:MAG: hypothetical protein ABSF47_01530 [Minisyncoccia bacterium]|jgi:predicted membrane channel-forming protein YqfA (hemolysin III family)
MKKDRFEIIWLVFIVLVYPISCVRWYKQCKEERNAREKDFIFYGILGTVGISALIASFFLIHLMGRNSMFIEFAGGILYLWGLKLFVDLALKLRKNSSAHGKTETTISS